MCVCVSFCISADLLSAFRVGVCALTVSSVTYWGTQRPRQVLPPWLCLYLIVQLLKKTPCMSALGESKERTHTNTQTSPSVHTGNNWAKIRTSAMARCEAAGVPWLGKQEANFSSSLVFLSSLVNGGATQLRGVAFILFDRSSKKITHRQLKPRSHFLIICCRLK